MNILCKIINTSIMLILVYFIADMDDFGTILRISANLETQHLLNFLNKQQLGHTVGGLHISDTHHEVYQLHKNIDSITVTIIKSYEFDSLTL